MKLTSFAFLNAVFWTIEFLILDMCGVVDFDFVGVISPMIAFAVICVMLIIIGMAKYFLEKRGKEE